ncbi:MAG: hypothetical protein DCF22_14250 [Leptolyngbya sp.]|nr:MAG: hypothetical protein DCF22_14250 [Leptolyngbya sp.]
MTLSQTFSKAIALLSAVAASSAILSAGIASAQSVNQTVNVESGNSNVVVVNTPTRGFGGAYVGGGVAAGVTNGGQQGDAATLGGNIQGRIAPFANVPVSARAAILFGRETTAIMPLVTYDLPIAANTNLYVGGGYSFVEKNGKPTPLGNKSAPVVTVGAETSVTRDIVVYGDAKLGIKAYENSPASALSFQAGVGYRF